jgi:hypothetical protein
MCTGKGSRRQRGRDDCVDGEGGEEESDVAAEVLEGGGEASVSSSGRRLGGSDDTLDSLAALGGSKCVEVPTVACIHSQRGDTPGGESFAMEGSGEAPLAQQEEDVEDEEEEPPCGERDSLLQEEQQRRQQERIDSENAVVAILEDDLVVESNVGKDEKEEKGIGVVEKVPLAKRWSSKRMTSEAEETEKAWKEEERTKRREEEEESQLKCYLTVFLAM